MQYFSGTYRRVVVVVENHPIATRSPWQLFVLNIHLRAAVDVAMLVGTSHFRYHASLPSSAGLSRGDQVGKFMDPAPDIRTGDPYTTLSPSRSQRRCKAQVAVFGGAFGF